MKFSKILILSISIYQLLTSNTSFGQSSSKIIGEYNIMTVNGLKKRTRGPQGIIQSYDVLVDEGGNIAYTSLNLVKEIEKDTVIDGEKMVFLIPQFKTDTVFIGKMVKEDSQIFLIDKFNTHHKMFSINAKDTIQPEDEYTVYPRGENYYAKDTTITIGTLKIECYKFNLRLRATASDDYSYTGFALIDKVNYIPLYMQLEYGRGIFNYIICVGVRSNQFFDASLFGIYDK